MNIKKLVMSFYHDATPNFHILRVTRPREALRLHCHEFYQVYFVISGRLVHHIENHSAILSYGDVFIIPPNIPHYIEPIGDEIVFYTMAFMPDFFPVVSLENKLIRDFLCYLETAISKDILPKISLPHGDTIFIGNIFDRINDEFSEHRPGKQEMIYEYVSVVLTLIARVYFNQKTHSLRIESREKAVTHCISYIQNHFNENISLSTITKHFAISKTAFCNLFRTVTGYSYTDYLNMYRIKKASDLIQEGEKLSAISSLCGYNDFSTFYRNFKKYMSMSPSQYQAVVTQTEPGKEEQQRNDSFLSLQILQNE